MRIEEFIDSTNSAADSNEVFRIFEKAIAHYGYDRTIYCVIGPSAQPAIICNYPDEWISYYGRKGYVRTDPARLHCAVSRRPFLWADVTRGLEKVRTLIFDEAAECGVRDGLGIPLHEPSGETKGIALASSAGGAEARPHLSQLHMLAMQFHLAYTARQTPSREATEIVLTAKETEVLKWLAQGKSKWVVGELLSISEHAVSFHCRNIFKKLGVSSTRMAVVKALQMGLIFL